MKDTSDRTPELFAAIQTSDVEQVKELLKSDISLEYKDNYGQTPLTLASSVGNLEIIRLLITAGAKLNPDPKPLVFNPRISGTELPGGQIGELIAQATTEAPEEVKNFYGGLISVLDTLSGKSEPLPDNLADKPKDIESAQDDDDDEDDEEDEEIACTPLAAAVLKGDVSTVKALLVSGAAPNPTAWHQTPVLVTAAEISRPLNSQNFALICPLKRFSHCLIKVVDKMENSMFQIILTNETGTFE